MTELNNSVAIAAEIETMRFDLATVTAAIPVMGKPAIATADKLNKAIDEAQAKLADALGNELLEAQKARLANFSAISVDWDREETNLTYIPFKIKYSRLFYDDRQRDHVIQERVANGFATLDEDVYEYLVTMRPDAIPAPIMALAPDDPHEAFDIYFAALRRGYFRTKAAA